MWVKVALAFLFFKVSNKVQFESFFINSLPNFLRSDLSKSKTKNLELEH